MRQLSSNELLDVWERGLALSSADRALTLLEAACSGGAEDPAALPLGERDARLLTLREWTFGPDIAALVSCPACGASQELNFHAADIRVPLPQQHTDVLWIGVDDYEIQVRLPNSHDLRALESGTAADPRRVFLNRCLVQAKRSGKNLPADEMPEAVIDAVSERMSEADPQADVQLALDCPDCGKHWSAAFDIASFFWTEIQAWAGRVLNEVHQLASAYGWSDQAILALSPVRRHFYLTLAAG